MKSKAKIRCSA